MSTQLNFNRTRNYTTSPSMWSSNRSNETDFGLDKNRSNESDFGPDRNDDSQIGVNPIDESQEIIFYLLITLVIPSIICFLFLFYNFIRLPHLRIKQSNLLLICLLIINFIHVSYLFSFKLIYCISIFITFYRC
jgi:hypothetical protein